MQRRMLLGFDRRLSASRTASRHGSIRVLKLAVGAIVWPTRRADALPLALRVFMRLIRCKGNLWRDSPAAVVADWKAHGLAIEICDLEPVTEDDLCLAHDRQYVESVLEGRLANGHGNKLPEVTNACLWTCGSMLAASRQALIDGIAVSPGSGFHHAHFGSNGGFTIFVQPPSGSTQSDRRTGGKC